MASSRKILRSFVATFFIIIGIAELLIPRIITWVLGSLFITVGIAGVVLPILNGTFFLILGLVLISFESKYVEKKLHRITSKNKVIHEWHLLLEKWLRKYFIKTEHNE